MKIFTAALMTETNTFSPLPAGKPAWETFGIARGSNDPAAKSPYTPLLGLWRDLAAAEGLTVVESLNANAAPSGRTSAPLYQEFKQAIIADLKAALPVDIVLLCLHGAMASDDIDDCEGDLLAAIRGVVGVDTVIAAEIDLHCHLTAAMLEYSDLLVSYKEFPHTDVGARGAELFRLAVRAARKEIRPVTRAYRCNMSGLWRTRDEPVKSFVAEMLAAEADGSALNISFGHGFNWADVADVGAAVWVTTDGNPDAAASLAETFGRKAFALRNAGRLPQMSANALIDRLVTAPPGLVVAADVADNPGGGAPGDSSFILARLIARQVEGAAVGALWDMTAVEICRNAGIGATMTLRIGGKCGVSSGMPIDGLATVRSIIADHRPRGIGNDREQLGTSVWVTIDGVDVVISSIRNQTFHPDVFTDHGIDLAARRLVVVKSIEHFRAAFGPLAAEIIYVDTPGALRTDFEAIPYTKRPMDYWPRSNHPAMGAYLSP